MSCADSQRHDGPRAGSFDAQASGQVTHRFREGHVVELHPEVDHASTAATREAVPVAFVEIHAEARMLIVMERASAAALGIQLDVLRNHVSNGDALLDLLPDRHLTI